MKSAYVSIIKIGYKSGSSILVPLFSFWQDQDKYKYFTVDEETFKFLIRMGYTKLVRSIVTLGSADIEFIFVYRQIEVTVSEELAAKIEKFELQ